MQKYIPYFTLVNSLFFGLFLLFISGALPLYAQNSKDLKQQKENLEKQIIWVENKIKNTLKQQDSALQKLDLLSEYIRLSEKKSSLLNAELKKVSLDLENQQEKKKILDQNQRKLQQAYKEFMVKAYKDLLQYDPLIFIFSADDFNQAIDRYKYTETHAKERKKSLLALKKNQEKINSLITELNKNKSYKNTLAQQEIKDKKILENQKNELESIIQKLQENQEKLAKNIQEEKIKKQEVDEKIKKAVQEELRIAQNQIAEKQSNQSHQKYTKLFEEKKGKMPFPIDQGFISMPFGRQAHKVLKYILEENAGIDITANPGAISFAVCEGIVTAIIYVPGTGYSVIVGHGNYRTIYSNLEEIYVVKDQIVKSSQKIGQVFTHPTSKHTIFHFEVWKTDEEKIVQLNPEAWIKKN